MTDEEPVLEDGTSGSSAEDLESLLSLDENDSQQTADATEEPSEEPEETEEAEPEPEPPAPKTKTAEEVEAEWAKRFGELDEKFKRMDGGFSKIVSQRDSMQHAFKVSVEELERAGLGKYDPETGNIVLTRNNKKIVSRETVDVIQKEIDATKKKYQDGELSELDAIDKLTDLKRDREKAENAIEQAKRDEESAKQEEIDRRERTHKTSEQRFSEQVMTRFKSSLDDSSPLKKEMDAIYEQRYKGLVARDGKTPYEKTWEGWHQMALEAHAALLEREDPTYIADVRKNRPETKPVNQVAQPTASPMNTAKGTRRMPMGTGDLSTGFSQEDAGHIKRVVIDTGLAKNKEALARLKKQVQRSDAVSRATGESVFILGL